MQQIIDMERIFSSCPQRITNPFNTTERLCNNLGVTRIHDAISYNAGTRAFVNEIVVPKDNENGDKGKRFVIWGNKTYRNQAEVAVAAKVTVGTVCSALSRGYKIRGKSLRFGDVREGCRIKAIYKDGSFDIFNTKIEAALATKMSVQNVNKNLRLKRTSLAGVRFEMV